MSGTGNQEGDEPRVAPTHTHDKLQAILGNFDPFDVEMKEGTRRRREYDEERLRELAAELARLQEALEKQVQIRVDMNQDLQSWMMTQVKEMTVAGQYWFAEGGWVRPSDEGA